MSSAECSAYSARLLKTHAAAPSFHPTFLEHVQAMLASQDGSLDDLMEEFVREFGTHFFAQATLGSRYGQISQVASHVLKQESAQNVKLSAKFSAMASVDMSSMLSKDVSKASSFADSCESQALFTIGSVPSSNGDAKTWAHETSTSPAVIRRADGRLLSSLMFGARGRVGAHLQPYHAANELPVRLRRADSTYMAIVFTCACRSPAAI